RTSGVGRRHGSSAHGGIAVLLALTGYGCTEHVHSHGNQIRFDPSIVHRAPAGKRAHHNVLRSLIIPNLANSTNRDIVFSHPFRGDRIFRSIRVFGTITHI